MNKQILATFTILTFALAITGYAYSTWIKTINIQGTLNMAEFSIYIDDYNNTKATLSTDKHTLTITDTITPGQTNWTGIIIKNNGTTPITITYEITTNNTEIWQTKFTHSEHFYGPYTETDDISTVWDKATTMPPPDGSTTPPIELPAQNMLVVWQNITLSETPPEPFTITITVTYKATFQAWTDTITIIYTLTYQGA
ncbi:MAG: hypothetical protein ACUVQW_04315 [Candidatus Bathycorpusculaceae bacterium]